MRNGGDGFVRVSMRFCHTNIIILSSRIMQCILLHNIEPFTRSELKQMRISRLVDIMCVHCVKPILFIRRSTIYVVYGIRNIILVSRECSVNVPRLGLLYAGL